MAKSGPSALSPLYLSYISSTLSLESLCEQYKADLTAVRKQARAESWEESRRQVAKLIQDRAVSAVSAGRCAEIRRLQTAERTRIKRRLKMLEDALDALSPTAERPEDRLTVAKIKAYAESAAILQRMLYRSYGIDTDRPGKAADEGIFGGYPAGSVISRYTVERVEVGGETDPPPQAKQAPPTGPHLPLTDPSHTEKPAPKNTAGESEAEIVEDKPIVRRRRGKLNGYSLTDVFDNMDKENEDEEGTADRRAEGDAEEAQADVVDVDMGLGAVSEDQGEEGMGKGEVVAGDSGGGEVEAAVENTGVDGEEGSDSGISRSGDSEPCEEPVEEGC